MQNELPSYVFDDGDVGNTDGVLLGEEDDMSISDLDETMMKSGRTTMTTIMMIHTFRLRRNTGPLTRNTG